MKGRTMARMNKTQCLGILIVMLLMLNLPLAFAGETLTDRSISDAVTGRLIVDQAVESNWIDVQTIDGIVTLSGHVDNVLSKDRAVNLAKTVRGVRAVINRIDVQAPSRNDNHLERDIKEALIWNPATESMEVSVEAANGIVQLSGTVDSWQERELVEYVAKGIRGVKSINNKIKIEYDTDRSDYELEQEIQQRLRWDAYVDDGLIEVAVKNNRVTLSGTVGSAAEKSRAVSVAWVTGVKAVNGENIDVEKWARDERFRKEKFVDKDDKDIHRTVEDALIYDRRVNRFDIDVTVDSGIVTLRGVVNNLKAKRAAEMSAENTVGVWKARNHIVVRPDQMVLPSDTTVESRIETALLNDPYVEKYEINVNVIEHVAYLSGEVDTYYEKGQAEEVTSQIMGVIDIKNNIRVKDRDNPLTYDPYMYPYWSVYTYPWYGYPTEFETTETDWEIQQNIESELWWSPFVDESEVMVTVEDGVAKLTGEVDTWNEYLAARENAYEGGAVYVKNRLDVEYGPQK